MGRAFNMPLRIDGFGDLVDSEDQEIQFPHNTAEHDEAIVKAVNYHDELVNALTSVVHRSVSPFEYRDARKSAEQLLERIAND